MMQGITQMQLEIVATLRLADWLAVVDGFATAGSSVCFTAVSALPMMID